MTLISANSEQEIGEVIARAMEKVDKERIITIVSMSLSHKLVSKLISSFDAISLIMSAVIVLIHNSVSCHAYHSYLQVKTMHKLLNCVTLHSG